MFDFHHRFEYDGDEGLHHHPQLYSPLRRETRGENGLGTGDGEYSIVVNLCFMGARDELLKKTLQKEKDGGQWSKKASSIQGA